MIKIPTKQETEDAEKCLRIVHLVNKLRFDGVNAEELSQQDFDNVKRIADEINDLIQKTNLSIQNLNSQHNLSTQQIVSEANKNMSELNEKYKIIIAGIVMRKSDDNGRINKKEQVADS